MSVDIATLSGSVEIEDKLSAKLDVLIEKVSGFSNKFDASMDGVERSMTRASIKGNLLGEAIGDLITKVVDLGAKMVVSLGEKGSRINGVTESFDNLARSVGSTGDALLRGLDDGVKSTVDSMDLMTAANRAMSAGLKVTEEDMKALGAAARGMAKSAGTDAAQELDTLFQALTTGRTRSLQMKGVMVDLTQAETKYARSLGLRREELNQTQRLEASREAILESVRKKVLQLGDAELSFKEKLKQVEIGIGNWWDALAVGIAKSPAISKAFDRIRDAFVHAFGDDVTALRERLLKWIDRVAEAAAIWGPKIINWLSNIWDGISNIYKKVTEAWNALPDWFKRIALEAALAGLAVGGLNAGLNAVTGLGAGGGDKLGTVASFATITSGLKDLAGVMLGPLVKGRKEFGELIKMTKAFGGEGFLVTIMSWVGPLSIVGRAFAALTGFIEGSGAAIAAFATGPVAALAAAIALPIAGQRALTGSWEFMLIPMRQLKDLFFNLIDGIGKSYDWMKKWLDPQQWVISAAAVKDWIGELTGTTEIINTSILALDSGFKGLWKTLEDMFPATTRLVDKLIELAGKVPTAVKAAAILATTNDPRGRPLLMMPMNTMNDIAMGDYAWLGPIPKPSPLQEKLAPQIPKLPNTAAVLGGANDFFKKNKPGSLAGPSPADEARNLKIQNMMDSLSGRTVKMNADIMIQAIQQLGGVTGLTKDKQIEVNKALRDAQDIYRAMKQEVPPALQAIINKTHDLAIQSDIMAEMKQKAQAKAEPILSAQGAEAVNRFQYVWTGVTTAIETAQAATEEWAVSMMGQFEQGVFQADKWEKSMLKTIEPIKKVYPKLWEEARVAIEGTHKRMVSDAKDASEEMSKNAIREWNLFVQEIERSEVAQNFAMKINLIGEVIGSIAQKSSGMFGGLISSATRLYGPLTQVLNSTKQMASALTVEAFELAKSARAMDLKRFALSAMTMGYEYLFSSIMKGLAEEKAAEEAWKERLRQIGVRLQELGWTAKDVNETIASFGTGPRAGGLPRVLDQAEAASKKTTERINELTKAVDLFGGRAPTSLKPYLDALLKGTRLTQEQRAALEAMAGGTSWQTIQEAAERYDITIDELGKNFNQLRGNDVFDRLFSDWTMFTEVGADTNAVMEKMKAQVNDVLNRARKFGTDVPEYMRPMLEAFMKAGKLIDENGNLLTDLGGINFSASIESSLQRVAELLEDIADLLKGIYTEDIKNPIKAGPRDGSPVAPRTPVAPGTGGAPRNPGVPETIFDGIVNPFPRSDAQDLYPKPVREAGGGWEGDQHLYSQAPQTATIQVMLDGRQLGEGLVPVIPGILARMRTGV